MHVRQRISIVKSVFSFLLLLSVWLATATGGQALGIPLPDTAEPTEAASQPAPSIEAERDPSQDERIAQRIRGFFGAIGKFSAVTVDVTEGVVTLSGTVPEQADIEEAARLAGNVQGVVTVENTLERDVSLGGGLGAIGSVEDRFADFVQMLPLLGAALLVALAIGTAGYLLAGFGSLWRRVTPNPFLAELVASAIRFGFIILGLVIALDMIGAGALLGAVLGGAGVIGIALGFAMRDTIENYVASLMLSLRQPFRANDHVLIDDLEGRVIRLTSRATILMTLDGNHLRIPNGQVFKAVILNYTRNPQRRFEFEMGIDADDNPDAARRLGRETMAGLPFVLADPGPEARTVAVGDSNIVIKFLGWIDQTEADFFKARSRALAAVKTALEGAGFGLPEPIYRLRFDPRTNPLPFENIGERATKEAPPTPSEPRLAPAPGDHAHEDVRPSDEIAQMVEAERATGGEEKDLLDRGRPVE
ncbi:mechanosensitive ion channel family protein [Qipengyuania sp. JC766]|uniref:mechanosensitive ion channel family protein n=1 Tax=Qipengyuania sp. JC766 TaxID=3232139 RepID=UPI00345A5ABA